MHALSALVVDLVISVVIPTLTGRELDLEKTIDAYERTMKRAEWELVVIRDASSWPKGCNEGFAKTKGDVIMFGADDLEPVHGWWEAATNFLAERDELPAARVWDYKMEGEHSNAPDGIDGTIVWYTRVPIMRRDQWERIGYWPLIDYYGDVWVSDKARSIGIETRMLYGYDFIHHWSQIRRVDTEAVLARAWEAYGALQRQLEEQARALGRTIVPPAPVV